MRTVRYKRHWAYGAAGEPTTGTVLDLILDIPGHTTLWGVLPPLHLLNAELATGGNSGGMGPGTTWRPFQVTADEYAELAAAFCQVDPTTVQAEHPYASATAFQRDPTLDHYGTIVEWAAAVKLRYPAAHDPSSAVPAAMRPVELLAPPRLWRRDEVLARPTPVPRIPGVYAWYFDVLPPGVPDGAYHTVAGWRLLYVGISPGKPPQNGRPPSRQNLALRIRYHYRGNAEGSTLRLTLGCLLADELGLRLRRVGSGTRLTFGPGEAVLSAWMAEHARVCWMLASAPWVVESYLMATHSLPLNLDQNQAHPFHGTLSQVRRAARAQARAGEIDHGSGPGV